MTSNLRPRSKPTAALAEIALWAPLAILVLGGAAVAASVEFDPHESTRLVAVFPPWWSAERALAAASGAGALAGAGGAGFVVAVTATHPGLAPELRRAGALFVADGRAFPACFPSSKTGSRP